MKKMKIVGKMKNSESIDDDDNVYESIDSIRFWY